MMGSSGALSGLLGGAGRVGTGAASEPEIGSLEDSYGCLVVRFSGLPGGHGDQGAAGSRVGRSSRLGGRFWEVAGHGEREHGGECRACSQFGSWGSLSSRPSSMSSPVGLRTENPRQATHSLDAALPRSGPGCVMSAVL